MGISVVNDTNIARDVAAVCFTDGTLFTAVLSSSRVSRLVEFVGLGLPLTVSLPLGLRRVSIMVMRPNGAMMSEKSGKMLETVMYSRCIIIIIIIKRNI